MTAKKDLTGQIFGKLTVINSTFKTKNNNNASLCKCDCGNETIIRTADLKNGHTTSCGCRQPRVNNSFEKPRENHGKSHLPEYKSYISMKTRCFNNKQDFWDDYGNRGIKICKRWLESFENFLEDMGSKPSSKHSLDRIDVNKDYEPTNCKWSTDKEQARNKTNNKYITYKNQIKSLAEWCEILHLSYHKIKKRFYRNWTAEKAFETP